MSSPDGPRGIVGATVTAVQWRMGGSLVSAVVQFAASAFLARLLTPADFGLVALALAVLGLSSVVGDLGITGALIQRTALTSRHIRTAVSISLVLGLAMTGVLWVLAPLGASLVDSAAVIPVVRTLAFSFVLRSWSVVAGALLRRRLEFRTLFIADFLSYIVGYAGLSIILAISGYGVWSIVWGGLAQTACSTAILVAVSRHSWLPLLGRIEVRELLTFGVGSTANGFVNYAATNGDNIVIGRLLDAASLGLYSRAYSLMNLPHTYTASIISSVLFPAFSRADGRVAALKRGYLIGSKLTALTAAPVMAGMLVAAPQLIPTVYGPGWGEAVVPLQILCVGGYFRALYHLGGSLTHACGKVYHELAAQIGYAVMVIAGAMIGASFGLPGVAAAVSVALLYMYGAMAWLSLKLSGASVREYLRAQAPGILLGLMVGSCALGTRVWLEAAGISPPVVLACIIAQCAAIWCWVFLVVIHDDELQPLRNRIPERLLKYVGLPSRVQKHLRTRFLC